MLFNDKEPIYLQIGDLICENILKGKWKEGDRLPSVRDFAISIEVNPNTVNRIYCILQEKNIIFNQRGIGYFVSPGAESKILDVQRDVFINDEIPKIVKKMNFLNISNEELLNFINKIK